MVELKIDPEFEEMVDSMTDEEFQLLEEKILEDGRIINPIVTWNGVIVDGHNRYKIAAKHPEIPFSVTEMEFECREAVGVWICKTQLARRNLNEKRRRYLIGKQYQEEKRLEKFHGNQYTSANNFGLAQREPNQNEHGTRTKVAKENGVSNSYVERADYYAQGVDVAEQAVPGIKKDIISGKVDASFKEVADLRKLPEEEQKKEVEMLKLPADQRKEEREKIAEESDSKGAEDSFLENLVEHTYAGIIKTFRISSDNLLARFPRLKAEKKYRDKVIELMEQAKAYADGVEEYLNEGGAA